MTDDHLTPVVSDRGFKRLPPIPDEYGGQVRAYESRAAEGPHIWLALAPNPVVHGNRELSAAHLSIENAAKLADQLRYLVDHHYQVEPSPDPSESTPNA